MLISGGAPRYSRIRFISLFVVSALWNARKISLRSFTNLSNYFDVGGTVFPEHRFQRARGAPTGSVELPKVAQRLWKPAECLCAFPLAPALGQVRLVEGYLATESIDCGRGRSYAALVDFLHNSLRRWDQILADPRYIQERARQD